MDEEDSHLHLLRQVPLPAPSTENGAFIDLEQAALLCFGKNLVKRRAWLDDVQTLFVYAYIIVDQIVGN